MADDRSARGRETVTAFFESRRQAQAALDRLRHEGLPVEEARLYEGDRETGGLDRETHRKGFREALGDLFLPHEDRDIHAEGLSRGGTLLSVPVGLARRSRVVGILHDEGMVDLDERRTAWRSEGWDDPSASPAFGDVALTSSGDDAGLRSGISGIGAHAAGAPPASFARRDASLGGRGVRSHPFDEASGEASRLVDVEIEDERRARDESPAGLATGRSAPGR